MAAPPPPPDPSVMIDELVEEFLLRLPPEDPRLLARTALVSRQWYGVVTGRSFRRRFREFHRSTPLLGYVHSLEGSIRFVPLSSFRPPRTHLRGVRAVSSNHGHVLLHRLYGNVLGVLLSVWHPITDDEQDLPVVPLQPYPTHSWAAAVICAVGDGCDHLHCQFKVVFVGKREGRTFSCLYSSEAGSWSHPVFTSEEFKNDFVPGSFVLIGTALYATCPARNEIFKYDLRTHQMCNISITPGPGVQLQGIGRSCKLIATEDGRLGFAEAINSTLHLWISENGRLEESRKIDLHTPLPAGALLPQVIVFAPTGVGAIFLWTHVGYFTIDLESGSCKKVGELSMGGIVPYVSICTPAGVAISSDEVPVADIA